MPERETRIPSNAKKVFEGVIFDVYHYELEDFNGRIRTFERLKRNDSVLILPVTDDGKIVIARQLQPHKPEYLDCFGGQIDPDELSVDAGRRELLEESGMTAKEMELWFTGSAGEKIDWVLYYYIARGVKSTGSLKEKIKLTKK
jgi:ADP-ribose pyrophosphatase